MLKAYRVGKAYQAGRGMNLDNLKNYLNSRGAQTAAFRNGVATNVNYGDPWSGTRCQAEACVFRSSMWDQRPNQERRQFGVVFAMW